MGFRQRRVHVPAGGMCITIFFGGGGVAATRRRDWTQRRLCIRLHPMMSVSPARVVFSRTRTLPPCHASCSAPRRRGRKRTCQAAGIVFAVAALRRLQQGEKCTVHCRDVRRLRGVVRTHGVGGACAFVRLCGSAQRAARCAQRTSRTVGQRFSWWGGGYFARKKILIIIAAVWPGCVLARAGRMV